MYLKSKLTIFHEHKIRGKNCDKCQIKKYIDFNSWYKTKAIIFPLYPKKTSH